MNTIESWQEMITSLDSHWEKYKAGEDFFGGVSKLSHLRQVILKAQILERWYRENPQGDDRPRGYLQQPKIALDIDQVLAGFVDAWVKKFNIKREVKCWNFDPHMHERLKLLETNKEFWLGLEALIKPADLPFEPHCYITARSIPQEWTEKWLFSVIGYPHAPVYSVGLGVSKVEAFKAAGCDILVDDSYKNFIELNNAGCCCFLWDTQQNRRHDVGYKRINNLNQLLK